ncbi:MAG: acyl carrier protein [Patescibacteria group bacterium]
MSTEIHNKVIAIIADKSDHKQEEIKLTDELGTDLGFDSLDGVELCMEVEKAFNIAFTDQEMETFNTVQDVVKAVEKKMKA